MATPLKLKTKPQLEKAKLKLDLAKNVLIIFLLAAALVTSCDNKQRTEKVLDDIVKLQLVVDSQEKEIKFLYKEVYEEVSKNAQR